MAFGSRLVKYEAKYASTGSRPDGETSSSGPAASAAVVVDRKEQGVELAEMRTAFNNLQKIVDRLHNRTEEQERKLDDLEQYGTFNCLMVHRCEEVPNRGKYLEHEKYVCNALNQNLRLNPLCRRTTLTSPIRFLRRITMVAQ